MGRQQRTHGTGTGTPAIDALVAAGIEHAVHRYDHDPAVTAYGDEAAQALGVEAGRIFKTLVVSTGGGGGDLAVAVVPVTSSLDLKALARAAGVKRVALADAAAAERVTGYVVGGISPLGQKRALPTFVDESARLADTMFVSGGRRGLELELAPDDLVALTRGTFAPLTP